ncbi:MAG TPA: hypothetical protein VKC34_12885 [Blastocatellia bacterium]|nr:hypothetical protein [Blastocatellia bacterium]
MTSKVRQAGRDRSDEPSVERGGAKAKSPRQFLKEIEQMKDDALAGFSEGKFGELRFGDKELRPEDRPQVIALLKAMVYPERIAADILSSRIPLIPDFDFKLRVAEQASEELQHLNILRGMLAEWGQDPDEMWENPLPELVKVFEYVGGLETLAEFFTANFIGESLLLNANLKVMRAVAPEAFSVYLDVSIPDEAKHIQLNREAIMHYATTAEAQDRARLVAGRLLDSFIEGYKAKLRFMAEMAANRANGENAPKAFSPGRI